jgi:hypothetical protein
MASLPISHTLLLLTLALSAASQLSLHSADTIFSGPQPGEKITPFRVLDLSSPEAARERDPVTAHSGEPTVLVFIHGLERSLVPLLRVVDEYGAQRKDRLHTELIFLAADRIEGERRARAAADSLNLQSPKSLSPDGIEGPGNYGLNKDCLMTIVAANNGVAAANFALVQPGIADAPAVLKALADLCGDKSPPSIDDLTNSHSARSGAARREAAMRRPDAQPEATRPPVDWEAFDLESEAGLRNAVQALIAEVQFLRGELSQARSGDSTAAQQPAQENFPGAVPTDPALQGMLRRFIQPSNDDATVDAVLDEVRAHIGDDVALRRQAIDGWTRILHFGDRYGTPYARRTGQAFLEELQRTAK